MTKKVSLTIMALITVGVIFLARSYFHKRWDSILSYDPPIIVPSTPIFNQSCITRIEIKQRINELLGEEEAAGIPLQSRFKAIMRDTTLIPLQTGTATSIDDHTYLIGRDPLTKQVVLNTKYLGDIQKTDAIRLPKIAIIGTYTDLLQKDKWYRRITEFLLKSWLIETYGHVSADICLIEEEETNTIYIAHFDAIHHYCTSECIDEPYAFSIMLDKKSNTITLLPRK